MSSINHPHSCWDGKNAARSKDILNQKQRVTKDDEKRRSRSQPEITPRNTPKINMKDIRQMEEALFPGETGLGAPQKTKLSEKWDKIQAAPQRERTRKKQPVSNLHDILMSQVQMMSCWRSLNLTISCGMERERATGLDRYHNKINANSVFERKMLSISNYLVRSASVM